MIPYETLHKDNPSFSQSIPGLQLVWDTVSTGLLKDCPYKYYLSMVEGWKPKRLSVHLYFGLLTHQGRETYDGAIANGESHEVALRATILHLLSASGTREEVLQCESCGWTVGLHRSTKRQSVSYEQPHHTVHSFFEVELCRHCNSTKFQRISKFFAWDSDDKHKNRENLLRTMVWLLEHYKNSDEKTVILADGKPAVELWFRYELPIRAPGPEGSAEYGKLKPGPNYILTGHIDRLVEFGGDVRFHDLKTTKSTIGEQYFKQYSPDNQMSFYNAGGKIVFEQPVVGGVIDAAQVAVNFTRFERGLINRSKAQVDEWLEDIQDWIKDAERMAIAKRWRMNDKACHHYGGCEFRDVCSKDPSARLMYLKKDFVQQVWNPLEERS